MSVLTADVDGKIVGASLGWWAVGSGTVVLYCRYWKERTELSETGKRYEIYSSVDFGWTLAMLSALACIRPVDGYVLATIICVGVGAFIKIYSMISWIDEVVLKLEQHERMFKVYAGADYVKAGPLRETADLAAVVF